MIYTFNLTVFDPSWFGGKVDIGERLLLQRAEKIHDPHVQELTASYVEFLRLGGHLRLTDLSRYLLLGILRRLRPIITGLSSTYLYRATREYGPHDEPDDIRGTPGGHFVVLAGYNRPERTVSQVVRTAYALEQSVISGRIHRYVQATPHLL